MVLYGGLEKNFVNPGSGHGLLPDGTRPQSESMLTQLLSVPCSAILMDMFKTMLMKIYNIRLSYLTLNMQNCFLNIIKSHVISYLGICSTEKFKFIIKQPYMLIVLYCQYHVPCCPGDFVSQGISRHGIGEKSRNIPSLASEEFIF